MAERVIRLVSEGFTRRSSPRVQDDGWRVLGAGGEPVPETLPAGPVIVPLATWIARRGELLRRAATVGVWLEPDDDPGALAADVATLPLIAVHFPKFTDGRGYSTAALLRARFLFKGELRAFGDVGRDQLFYLRRVGFDAFSLPPQRDPVAALASFGDFSNPYQGSIDEPRPLFRRRGPAGLIARASPSASCALASCWRASRR